MLPIIGDTLRIMKTGLIDLSQERQKKYGPIHRTWLIGQRNVFVSDTASVRRILNGEHTIVEGALCMHMYLWDQNLQQELPG